MRNGAIGWMSFANRHRLRFKFFFVFLFLFFFICRNSILITDGVNYMVMDNREKDILLVHLINNINN